MDAKVWEVACRMQREHGNEALAQAMRLHQGRIDSDDIDGAYTLRLVIRALEDLERAPLPSDSIN